jgi:septal ring factor EnvC (AmiA/AmiB activator)
MDGLSGAASVIAVVGLTAKIATLCFQYANAVKDAKSDIERLKKAVADIKHVLESVAQLLDKQDKSQLSTSHQLLESLDGCRQQLTVLKTQLEPGKARKAMKHFSLKPLKWPFTSTKVDKIVASLEKYQQTFNLALQVDQT